MMTRLISSRKRIAAVGIVLMVLLIAWEVRRMPGRPSAVVTPPAPALKPLAPVPPTEPAKKSSTIVPVPAPVRKKSAVTKKNPAALPSLPPASRAGPVTQIPVEKIPPSAPPPPVPLEWHGNDTSITHPGEVVVRSDRQWIQFWAEHHPHEPAPDVDFAQGMVIGVFAGPRPADQFTIRMVDIRTLADSLAVDYQEKLPPPGTFAVDVTVYPYQLKVVPRSALPVKFNKLAPINPNR